MYKIYEMRMKFKSLKYCENNHGIIKDEATIQSRDAGLSEGIKALVITCIDYRLIDEAVYYLNNIGYMDNYDGLM